MTSCIEDAFHSARLYERADDGHMKSRATGVALIGKTAIGGETGRRKAVARCAQDHPDISNGIRRLSWRRWWCWRWSRRPVSLSCSIAYPAQGKDDRGHRRDAQRRSISGRAMPPAADRDDPWRKLESRSDAAAARRHARRQPSGDPDRPSRPRLEPRASARNSTPAIQGRMIDEALEETRRRPGGLGGPFVGRRARRADGAGLSAAGRGPRDAGAGGLSMARRCRLVQQARHHAA